MAEETFKPPAGVRAAARRAIKWIEDGKAGKGFTSVGRGRATQLANGEAVSRETIGRMANYFGRHTPDRKATGFNSGEEGFPSPGRVAWDAWGGDAGQRWANSIMKREKSELTEAELIGRNIGEQVVAASRSILNKAQMTEEVNESVPENENDEPVNATPAMMAKQLDALLRRSYSFYYRAHAFHWNTLSPMFAQFHELFSVIYTNVYGSLDDMAENVRRLGFYAPQQLSLIGVGGPVLTDPIEMVKSLLEENAGILDDIVAAFETAEEISEQGILNFLAERQDSHEKFRWFLSATLNDGGIATADMNMGGMGDCCPSCDSECESGWGYCPNCGAELADKMKDC
jgi:DNA-binding ferritin-like protein